MFGSLNSLREQPSVFSFNYAGGVVSDGAGWAYDIRGAFLDQFSAQPNYANLTEINLISGVAYGATLLANMALGLADDSYRQRYGVVGRVLSNFGAWREAEGNRRVWAEAAAWFAAVTPPVITQPDPAQPPANGGQEPGSSQSPPVIYTSAPPAGTPPANTGGSDAGLATVPTLLVVALVAGAALFIGRG